MRGKALLLLAIVALPVAFGVGWLVRDRAAPGRPATDAAATDAAATDPTGATLSGEGGAVSSGAAFGVTLGTPADVAMVPPPNPVPVPVSAAPRSAPAAPPAPTRPPEYIGVVERVKLYPLPAPAGRLVVQVLVRYTQAGRPTQLVWAHLDDAVLEQNGANLEAGAAVRVWAPGGVAKSRPPQVWAEYIVCEPTGK